MSTRHVHHLVILLVMTPWLSNIAAADKPDPQASAKAVEALRDLLTDRNSTAIDLAERIADQPFAKIPLTREDAVSARNALTQHRLSILRKERAAEMDAREIKLDGRTMKFDFKRFGETPKDGRSLYISLHGGGGAPSRVNDRQWENQKRLYELEEGIYVAPRAPTDTWDLWHQAHLDPMLDRLIENMVALEHVNWNRVYVMGYSAGGDGVFQLAPRMADRWAAAAMMAGHPNETSPLGLRNVPFALQVGGQDAAYQRNEQAARWKTELARLHAADPEGYEHFVKIYPDKAHWMDREDAVAIPWMAKHTRDATPKKLVWKQDDVTHDRFYWLGVDESNRKPRSLIQAKIENQTVHLSSPDVKQVTVRLDDRLVDLDQSVTIVCEGIELHRGTLARTIGTLSKTPTGRSDPNLCFPCELTVSLPEPFPQSLVPADTIPRYSAVRCDVPPKIDGKLDDQVWRMIPKTNAFVDLISGESTQHDTQAAITWDDENLYIGFWISEPNVDAKYSNRDDPIYYDNDVEVFIAGQDAYYEFEINALGTLYEAFFVWKDAYQTGDYSSDPQLRMDQPKVQDFNGVGLKHHPRGKRIAFLAYDFPKSRSAVHINGTLNDDSDVDQGWTVELAFPWQEMKPLAMGDGRSLPPKPGDRWRIDLFRFNKYKTSPPSKDSGGWAWGKHTVWDSHIPEIFPIVTFADK